MFNLCLTNSFFYETGVARLLFREKFSQKKRMKHNGEASSGLVGVQRSTSFLFSPTFYSSVMSSSMGRQQTRPSKRQRHGKVEKKRM